MLFVWCVAMTVRFWLPSVPSEQTEQETEKLQGTWQVVMAECDGVEDSSEKLKYVRHTFKGESGHEHEGVLRQRRPARAGRDRCERVLD